MAIGQNVKIKDLPKIERPREKLIHYGSGRLSNSELLALLLRSGKKGENVISLANNVLKKYKAENLPNLTYEERGHLLGTFLVFEAITIRQPSSNTK